MSKSLTANATRGIPNELLQSERVPIPGHTDIKVGDLQSDMGDAGDESGLGSGHNAYIGPLALGVQRRLRTRQICLMDEAGRSMPRRGTRLRHAARRPPQIGEREQVIGSVERVVLAARGARRTDLLLAPLVTPQEPRRRLPAPPGDGLHDNHTRMMITLRV